MTFAKRSLCLAVAPALVLGLVMSGCRHPVPPDQTADDAGHSTAAVQGIDQTARTVLEGAADSLDPAIRGRALADLVRASPSPGGGAWAPRGLHDPSPRVRRDVADALDDRLPEPESLQALLALARRSEVDPLTACLALLPVAADSPAIGAQAALVARRARSPAQAMPCWLAGVASGDDQAGHALHDALSRGVLKLDLPLLLGLARTPSPAISEGLAAGLDRVDELGQGAAAAVLLGQGNPRGAAALRQILAQGSEEAAMEAIDFLAALDVPAAEELLARAPRANSPRVATYVGLARLAHGVVVGTALHTAMQSDHDELLELALRCADTGMRRHPDGSGVQRAAHRLAHVGLASDDGRVRVATAALVATLGPPLPLATLADWLDADDIDVRLAAAAVLLRRRG